MKKITLLLAFVLPLAGFAQSDCSTATVITEGTHTVGTLTGTDLPNPDCSPETLSIAAAEWYSFTPATSGTYIVTSYMVENLDTTDTRVHLYTGTCGALTCAGFNDDINLGANIFPSSLIWDATAGTTYYIVFDDEWSADGFSFMVSALDCNASLGVPYTTNFANGVETACYIAEDVDGNTVSWITQFLDLDADGIQESFATNGSNGDVEKNDWFFTAPFAMTAGNTYDITYTFNGANAGAANIANETLTTYMTDAPVSTATFMQQITSNSGIPMTGALAELQAQATTATGTFTPAADGNYHLAFNTTSPPNSGFLLLFSYSVEESLATPGFENGRNTMYPNPATNVLNIMNQNVIDSVEIYNLMGQKVASTLSTGNEVQMNVTGLSSGAYMVKVVSGNNSQTMKFVKK